MLDDSQRLLLLLNAAGVFGLVTSLWLVGVVLWSRRRGSQEKRIENRLLLPEMERGGKPRIIRLWSGGEGATAIVPGAKRGTMADRIRLLHSNAGFQIPLASVALSSVGAVIVTVMVVIVLTGKLLLAACAGAAMAYGISSFIGFRVSSRAKLFENQFLDALALATRSLRAGYSLPAPFRLIVEEMDPPVSTVFSEICQQAELGVSLEDAMRRAALTTNSDDFRLFASAMIIQLRSGGNVADLMDRLTVVTRIRLKIHRRVRILTAQTQFSKKLLLALPFFLFFMLNVLDPDYMSLLYTTAPGKMMLVVSVGMLGLGSWMMNRIAILKY